MADSANLADEFAPPETKAAPVDIASEFEAPPKEDQHAVINNAADKAHQWQMAKTSGERLDLVKQWFSEKGTDVALKNASEVIANSWDQANAPFVKAPRIPDSPDVEALKASVPAFKLLGGVYNGLAPIASELTTPVNLTTMGTFGALTKAAKMAGAAGTSAKVVLNGLKVYFGAEMAKGAGAAAGEASVNPSIENVTHALASSGLAILAGHSAAEGLVGKETASPAAEPGPAAKETPPAEAAPATPAPVSEGPATKEAPAPAEPAKPVETVASAAVKLADGTVHTGKTHGQIVGELGDADLSGADDGFVTSTGRYVTREEGMQIAKASAQMDNSNQGPDRLYSEHLDPNQSRPPMKMEEKVADTVANQSPEEFQKWSAQQPDGITAEAQKVGKAAVGDQAAVDQLRQHFENAQAESKTILQKFEAGDDAAGDQASAAAAKVQFFREALEVVDKPDLVAEFAAPGKDTPEHAAITEELAQTPPTPPPAELTKELAPPQGGPTGIKNAIVDQERAARNLPPAMEAGKHAFGEAWDEASARVNKNPNAGFELVKEINEHPRAIGDVEDALLLRHQIELQNEFDKVAERVSNGAPGQSAESLAEDKTQLSVLSDHLIEAYDANRKAGTETGRGLNARRMLANEDFSLAKMVTKKRAANGGRGLSDEQLAEVQQLKDKIDATQKAFDEYVAKQTPRRARAAVTRDNAVTRLISERAQAARSRIAIRLERAFTKQAVEGEDVGGLLSKENLSDLADVATEYIAKGVDAGAELIKEFGERIRPHLAGILKDAQGKFEDSAIEAALTAKKARLEKTIAELTKKVETGDTSTAAEKASRPSIQEIETLQQRRDALQTELADARKVEAKVKELNEAIAEKEKKLAEGDLSTEGLPSNRPAPEAIEKLKAKRDLLSKDLADARMVESRLESIKDEIAEKKEMLASGDVAKPDATPAVNRPASPEMERAKQELADVDRQLADARKPSPVEKAAAVLDKQIEELQRQIDTGEVFPEGKAPKVEDPALKAKSDQLEQLKYERDNMRETIQPSADPAIPRTPEEIRLAAAKTRLERSTADYEERTANQDFGPQEKPAPLRLDAEGERLKADNERAKQEFQTSLIRDQLEHRTLFEKMQDTFVKWRRGFLLSGPITLGKLTAAAAERGAFTPVEEGVGLALPKALQENAPRQGGFSVKAEANAITSAFTKGMADAAKTLKTGKSDLDVLYGHGSSGNVRVSDVIPRTMIDFFGSLHGALKAPVKRAEFERSLQKRTEHAIRTGVDVSDPMVQTRLAVESYKDANRAIFMQDNVVTNAWNAGLRLLEAKQKATGQVSVPGKIISTTLRTLLPIVKVPTNIVAETFEVATGSVTGSVKLAMAFRKGFENLTPEQSDVIARELKKGSLGAAVIALGYFNPDVVGGYYQQDEKRKPGDVKPGTIRVYGQNVPSFLLHNPLLETLQLGATIRRVADTKVKGQPNGIATGVWTGALGLTEELPFVRTPIELAKVFDPKERAYAEGELAKGFLVPQAVDFAARATDTKANGEPQKRKPATVIQHIETGIPGLRQTVPKRN